MRDAGYETVLGLQDGQGRVVSTIVKRLIDEHWEHHRLYTGVCSNYLCDLQPGDTVSGIAAQFGMEPGPVRTIVRSAVLWGPPQLIAIASASLLPQRTAQWLTSGFLLTMAVVIPMSGSLLQRHTVRGIYAVSMALFCTGTLVAALAPGFAVLLVGRIIQACGTAVMMPLLMTTVIAVFIGGSLPGQSGLRGSGQPAAGPWDGFIFTNVMR